MINQEMIEKCTKVLNHKNLTPFEILLLKTCIKAYNFAIDCNNLHSFTVKFYFEAGNVNMSLFWDIFLVKNNQIEKFHFNDNPKFECNKLKVINVNDLYRYFEEGKMDATLTKSDNFKPYKKTQLQIEPVSLAKKSIEDDIQTLIDTFNPNLLIKVEKLYLENKIGVVEKERKSSKI
jgi:hypothetical protein